MYNYLFVGGSVKEAGNALKGKSSAWSVPKFGVKDLQLPPLKLGSFDTLVRMTEDLAKADGQLEGFCRRIERTLGEADKELEIRKGEKQVEVIAQAIAKEGPNPAEVGGWYYNIGTHNGKPLYKGKNSWLYAHTDGMWYIDNEKAAGVGATNKTYIFSGSGSDRPPTQMAPGSSYGGNCQLNVDKEINHDAPISLPPGSEERDFRIQLPRQDWVDLDEYVQKYEWDAARFPPQKSVAQTLTDIMKYGSDIDETFKNLSSTYNEEKGRRAALNTRDTGSHATRDLIDVLTPQTVQGGDEIPTETDDFIFTNSITTVLVAVHEKAVPEFLAFYEGNSEEKVIPRSAKKLGVAKDKDGFELWRVLCFKDSAEKFKKACRENKFSVRDYPYTKAYYAQTIADREVANAGFFMAHRSLVEGGVRNFSDLFVSWVHVKVLRIIVEGSLRYGTEKSPGTDSFSPKMSACILAPLANALPKARADLSQVLGTQGDKAMEGGDDAEEYYPYVSVSLAPLSTSK